MSTLEARLKRLEASLPPIATERTMQEPFDHAAYLAACLAARQQPPIAPDEAARQCAQALEALPATLHGFDLAGYVRLLFADKAGLFGQQNDFNALVETERQHVQ